MVRPFAIIMVLAAMPISSHADTFGIAGGHYTIQQSSLIAFTVSRSAVAVSGAHLASSPAISSSTHRISRVLRIVSAPSRKRRCKATPYHGLSEVFRSLRCA